MNHKTPILKVDPVAWLSVLRNITNSTNERSIISSMIPSYGAGHSLSLMTFQASRAIASSLVMANMNSLPLDWVARCFVGGVNLSFFILKQLPILPPEVYLEKLSGLSKTNFELVVPRAFELTYTSWDLESFANDLGYDGPPFVWDQLRRHRLKSELDAIYMHIYGLDRADAEWILDAPPPSLSFSTLKQNEIKEFGEYRTQRYVLTAYDQICRGQEPCLS